MADPHAAAPHWDTARLPEFFGVVCWGGVTYARTEAGLMWWDAANRLWTSVRQNPFELYCTGLATGLSLAQQPLYGLEGRFLFVSHDGGRAWERRALAMRFLPAVAPALAADPALRSHVYLFGLIAGTSAGALGQYALYTSGDAGRTWNGPLAVGPAEIAPGRHGFFAVPPIPGVYHSGGLFMSTGRSLYRLPGVPMPSSELEPVIALLAGGEEGIVATAASPRAGNPIAIAVRRGEIESVTHVQISLDLGRSWTVRDPYTHKFVVDDLLYIDDLLFVKLVHWDPAQNGKNLGAILMSRDNGASYVDVTAPDMVEPLARPPMGGIPVEPLSATPTHLYVIAQGSGAHAIALDELRKVGA
jgi:hypothetical protein